MEIQFKPWLITSFVINKRHSFRGSSPFGVNAQTTSYVHQGHPRCPEEACKQEINTRMLYQQLTQGMFAVPPCVNDNGSSIGPLWCEHTDHFSWYTHKGYPGCPDKACKLELSTSMLYQWLTNPYVHWATLGKKKTWSDVVAYHIFLPFLF